MPFEKLRPQYKERILLMQDFKLVRHSDELAKEWKDRLKAKATNVNTKSEIEG